MMKKSLTLLLMVFTTVATVIAAPCLEYSNSCNYPTCTPAQEGGFDSTCSHDYCDDDDCYCPLSFGNVPVYVSRGYKTWNDGSPGPNAIHHCQSSSSSSYSDPHTCCDCDSLLDTDSCYSTGDF